MDLDPIIRPRIAAAQTPPAYSGEVSRLDGQGNVFVTAPGLSGDYEHGPVKLTSAATPVEGQGCLLIFDEERVPWILLLEVPA